MNISIEEKKIKKKIIYIYNVGYNSNYNFKKIYFIVFFK